MSSRAFLPSQQYPSKLAVDACVNNYKANSADGTVGADNLWMQDAELDDKNLCPVHHSGPFYAPSAMRDKLRCKPRRVRVCPTCAPD